jgi:Yip1 domain
MNIAERAKRIILTPKTEWPVIAAEEPNIRQIVTEYVLPLALIPAIASIIGLGLIGRGMMSSFGWGLAMGVMQFAVAFVGVYVSALVVDFLAPKFASQKNLGRADQLVAYSCTPVWVAGILYIIPILGALVILAGIYGLYLMYLGLPQTMRTPPDKVIGYLVVSIIAMIVIYWIISLTLSSIIFSIFGLSSLTMRRGM